MGKLLLLILFGVALYLVLKRGQRSRDAATRGARATSAEAMIPCAYCRVHVPLSESLGDGDRRYCSEEHRRLGRH